MSTASFVAATVPAQTVRVTNTTLFEVAMLQTGDALQWAAIARLNGLTDPWLSGGPNSILIPPVLPSGPQTGILGL